MMKDNISRMTIVKLKDGVAIEPYELSIQEIVVLSLQCYMNVVELLNSNHPKDCNCKIMKMHNIIYKNIKQSFEEEKIDIVLKGMLNIGENHNEK